MAYGVSPMLSELLPTGTVTLLLADVEGDSAPIRPRIGVHTGEVQLLFGVAEAIRERTGEARFVVHQPEYEDWAARLREAVELNDFGRGWSEGAAVTTDESIVYAQRGRGERKKPIIGWESLTPTEMNVVRLVNVGLSNKEIATRLFISPRTVDTHLTHVYSTLGLTSRVQLAQEAGRHA